MNSCRGKPFNKTLLHTMETVVIEWSHEMNEVFKRTSAQPLLDGKNPGPLVEVDFWKARVLDLESVVDQLDTDKVRKMTTLLEKTQSSYYPSLQRMVRLIMISLCVIFHLFVVTFTERRYHECSL